MAESEIENHDVLALYESRDVQHGSVTSSESGEGAEDEESTGRKRKRPMNVTCEACKQRKVKCDREQPSCGWCTRNDHVCEYRERKKPGLRAGYGRELETRLDRLESLLSEQSQQLAAHLATSCSMNVAGQTPARASYDNTVLQQRQQDTVIDPNLRLSASRYESLQYPPAPPQSLTRQQYGQLQGHYTPSAQSQSLTSPQTTQAFHTVPSFNDQSAHLPPYDLLYALVDLYFKHINVWLPLLDRKTILDTLFGTSPLEEADRVLLHAIVATTLRYSRDSRLTTDSRQSYYNTSKQRVQLFGLENSSVRSLQALVILALDATGTTNGPPGWNILSLISRSVVQLGLSVESTSLSISPLYPSIATLRASILPEPQTWIDDEERRRLFWAIFLLDRYATIATAFEFALDEKEVDRRLPCRDDLFAANKSIETRWYKPAERPTYTTGMTDVHGHFSYHCELVGILGHVHQFLKRPINIGSLPDVEQWQRTYKMLDSDLNAWHFSLPDDFTNITRILKSNNSAKTVNPGWIMLHAAYCLTVIRLNSSAAYPSQTSPIFSSSYSAMQRCISAVDNMRQLANFVRANGLLDKLGTPFAFSAWVCARVTLVHGSTMDHEIDPAVGFFVTILSEMGQYWDVARRYSEILSRVLEEYRQSQQSVATMGERVTPSTVRILADMRRCAYDLDFLISRQPHVALKSYHPTRMNTPALNELEYLDVFDLFNFPRLPTMPDGDENSNAVALGQPALPDVSGMSSGLIPNFAVPNPAADWLFGSDR